MKIPYLTHKKLANGERAYYFNIPARLIPAGCLIKSQPLGKDYIKACQKAIELYKKIKQFKEIKEDVEVKSFGYVWSLYIQNRRFIELSDRSKQDYMRAKDIIFEKENKNGQKLKDIPLDLFDDDSAYKLYQRFVETHKKRWAEYCIAVLRLVYNYGLKKEIFTKPNPFQKLHIKKVKPKKRYIPTEHVFALINKAIELDIKAVSLAIGLNFYLCQRPADVLKIRRKDIYQKGDYYFVNILQNKTKEFVKAPIPSELIPEILSKKDYIICNTKGKPYTVNSFGKLFKKVNNACGFDYTFSLLRHSGSTAMIEAGVNSSAAISITGHTNEEIFNTTYKGSSERIGLMVLEQRKQAEKNLSEKE